MSRSKYAGDVHISRLVQILSIEHHSDLRSSLDIVTVEELGSRDTAPSSIVFSCTVKVSLNSRISSMVIVKAIHRGRLAWSGTNSSSSDAEVKSILATVGGVRNQSKLSKIRKIVSTYCSSIHWRSNNGHSSLYLPSEDSTDCDCPCSFTCLIGRLFPANCDD